MDKKKHILRLTQGNLVAYVLQALAVIILPILFTKEDMGTYAPIMATAAILTPLIGLRLEISTLIASTKRQAAALAQLQTYVSTFSACLLLFVVLIFNQTFNILNFQYTYSILIAFSLINYLAISNLLTRFVLTKSVNKLKILQSLLYLIFIIAFSILSLGWLGIVASITLSYVIGVLILIPRMKKFIKLNYKVNLLLRDTYIYLKTGKYFVLETLLFQLSMNVPIIFLSKIYSEDTLGLIWYSMLLLQVPTAIIGVAIGNIITVNFAKFENAQKYEDTFRRDILLLVFFSIFIFMLGVASLDFIFNIKPFTEYSVMKDFISILLPFYFLQFITSPVSLVLYKFTNIKIMVALQLFGLFIRVGIFNSYVAIGVDPLQALSNLGQIYYYVYFSLIIKVVMGRRTFSWLILFATALLVIFLNYIS